MLAALVTVKAILTEADLLSQKQTDVANGLAISLYQDSVELYLWSLVKKLNITVAEKAGFLSYISSLHAKGHALLYQNQLTQLNTARISFKHYGNFPAASDVVRFGVVVKEFFNDSCHSDFGVAFADVSVTALVQDVEIRDALTLSERSISSDDLLSAAEGLGIAQYLMLRKLSEKLPKISTKNLYPRSGVSEAEGRAEQGFENVGNSLRAIRDLLVVGLNRIDLKTHEFARSYLPTTHRLVTKKFYQNHNVTQYTRDKLDVILRHITDTCISAGI
jgi:hypothetical protein